jgi:hypothetical protein
MTWRQRCDAGAAEWQRGPHTSAHACTTARAVQRTNLASKHQRCTQCSQNQRSPHGDRCGLDFGSASECGCGRGWRACSLWRPEACSVAWIAVYCCGVGALPRPSHAVCLRRVLPPLCNFRLAFFPSAAV